MYVPFSRLLVFSGLLACILCACRASQRHAATDAPTLRPLRIAAASDVEPAFVALGRRYTEQSGREVVFSFASSAVLAQQVRQGAPFDLFAAANAEAIEQLVQSGRIVRDSARSYARGRLVLWTHGDGHGQKLPVPATFEGLRAAKYRRIALANPEHAPYGQAAVSALRSAGLWDELRKRLVYGENVRQAHQYVKTGNADAAIGALSLALADKDGGSHALVPEALYPPLWQVLGVVSGGDEQAAERFADLLFSAEGQAVLARYGFLPGAAPPSATALAPAASAPAWEFAVEMADAQKGELQVTMILHGFSGDVRLCLFMDGAERHLHELRRQSPGPAITVAKDCWQVAAATPQGTIISYKYDLRALADEKNQPDYAERFDATYIFNDQAVLLHPSPLPTAKSPNAPVLIDVEFMLPASMPLFTPWTALSARRFRFDSEQHDGGSYIGLGKLLGDAQPIFSKQIVGQMRLVSLPHRASAPALRQWIEQALDEVTAFYGDLIGKKLNVILVPMRGTSEPGLMGTVLRQGTPSVVIYYGADCEVPSVSKDWLAVHELFHIGNPILEGKIPWFVEGFTTYYQDVLRARAGALGPEEAWADLVDGFQRFCQPQNQLSLIEESHELYRSHRYRRVYWGGACLAFIADATIRFRSHGQRRLDDVLYALRRQSLKAALNEEDLLAALDEATGEHLISRLAHERRRIAVADWLRRIGVSGNGSPLRLNDAAPLAELRKSIFVQPN